MPVVDFYILATDIEQDCLLYCCNFVAVKFAEARRVYIHTPNRATAEAIDELLWTFRDESFIPHTLADEGLRPVPPVQIGHGAIEHVAHDTLVNLADDIPSSFMRYRHLVQLIPNNEAKIVSARNMYRYYREQGCALHFHDLRKAATTA